VRSESRSSCRQPRPFNAVEALPKSAKFLSELRDQFGNLGLAAAAYNAGPQRVRDFIEGGRALPMETQNYVLAITGRSAYDWAQAAQAPPGAGDEPQPRADVQPATCHDLVAQLSLPSHWFAIDSDQRRVPGWCRHVNQANVAVCGLVHQQVRVVRTSSFIKPLKLRGRAAVGLTQPIPPEK
jgi:hypothetical protein